MASNRVNWSDPAVSGVFELMIAVLISRLHPGARRLDGSGGDSGRDIVMPLASGLEIFELKSFTGRVSSSRRTQVKRSLARASQHDPSAWHLVVPIQPTQAEDEWFRRLTADCPFECDWLGLDWLDSHMADFPAISRYYIEGSRDEVLNALIELQREQAALAGGIPDAIERLTLLAARLNEISPHYVVTCAIDELGSTHIKTVPRYNGAEQDAPMMMVPAFRFPDTDEGRKAAASLRETFAFGTASTIPDEYVTQVEVIAPSGLGGVFGSATLAIGPVLVPSGDPPEVFACVIDDHDVLMLRLPLKVVERTAGTHGGEMKLGDLTGTITMKMRMDAVTKKIHAHVSYKAKSPFLPCQVLPATNFCELAGTGNRIVFIFNDQPLGPPGLLSLDLPGEFRMHAQVLRDLETVQRLSGNYFPAPAALTADEWHDIRRAARLLADGRVVDEWTAATKIMPAAEFREFSNKFDPEAADIWCTAVPHYLSLDGRRYFLGFIKHIFRTARIESWDDMPGDCDEEPLVEVKLVPGSESSVQIEVEEKDPGQPFVQRTGFGAWET
jgi:hypothetical protein